MSPNDIMSCFLQLPPLLHSWCQFERPKLFGHEQTGPRFIESLFIGILLETQYFLKEYPRQDEQPMKSSSSALSITPWWRHQMETFSALLAICEGNSPVPGEFPTQRPVTRSFDVFLDLRLNKRLRKQSWGWWLETLSRPLWRHRNATGADLQQRIECSEITLPPMTTQVQMTE